MGQSEEGRWGRVVEEQAAQLSMFRIMGMRGPNHMIKHSKHWSLQPASRSPEQLDKYESGGRGKGGGEGEEGENNREKESLRRLDHSCCVLSARWIRGSISLSLCRAVLHCFPRLVILCLSVLGWRITKES